MKVKRRKKSSRFRGSHSHKRGFKKKARGSGHRGGFGMSGTGKRADHRKSYILAVYGPDYFGKRQTRQSFGKKKLEIINVQRLAENIEGFAKEGMVKENKGVYSVELPGYKVVGELERDLKMIITADAASAGAIESVRKHGGDILVSKKEKEKAEDKK